MRTAILDTVRDSPGIHLRALTRDLDCSTSTIEYHLDQSDQLRDRHIRGYLRLYPVTIPEQLENPLAALNNKTRGPLLLHLYEHDKLGFSDLAARIDKSPSTVSNHLGILEDADLVTTSKNGREKYYQPEKIVSQALRQHRPGLLDRWTDNFISLWDSL